MIAGIVTARREARLSLTVLGPRQQEQRVEFVIDTGFNGALTLPGTVIHTLRLQPLGARPVVLGDGSTAILKLYRARLLWHESERALLVLQADGDPLLGMALLDGSRVIMDVVDNGSVTIEPIP